MLSTKSCPDDRQEDAAIKAVKEAKVKRVLQIEMDLAEDPDALLKMDEQTLEKARENDEWTGSLIFPMVWRLFLNSKDRKLLLFARHLAINFSADTQSRKHVASKRNAMEIEYTSEDAQNKRKQRSEDASDASARPKPSQHNDDDHSRKGWGNSLLSSGGNGKYNHREAQISGRSFALL
ncbi:hypothetical protein IFM58399_03646 [Aspergillus lentulus]|uniref:uncharacterized protein n=1 Tax=Aspergillus lentulus TaxID=293939 RepID=UPI001395240C|nr:uncharacterized protein IFM58399_03646 [Aspergillus lentulus]GFF33747.1 hypothetical protein IFM58399_03646 [Aspergillus lentulus]GFG07732.1 hypothetical protein IFM61392_05008 [Aspergillus lentulus]